MSDQMKIEAVHGSEIIQQFGDEVYLKPMPLGTRGEHVWAVAAFYRIANPADCFTEGMVVNMDAENLLSIIGPQCWKCAQAWTPLNIPGPLCPETRVKEKHRQIVCHWCGMSTWHNDHCDNALCEGESA